MVFRCSRNAVIIFQATIERIVYMKRLNVTIQCLAVYNNHIDVPDNLTFEEAITYAKEHIGEIPLGTLEYVRDSDTLDEGNCDFDS